MTELVPKLAMRTLNYDPQSLLSSILRDRIYESTYWKDRCFALNAETMLDRAKDLDCIGTTYGNSSRPTHFLCLLLKLLQIQPEVSICKAFLDHSNGPLLNDPIGQRRDLRYLRALTAVYIRMVGTPETSYQMLEPLLADHRTLNVIDSGSSFKTIAFDELVESLLNDQVQQVISIGFPYLPKRSALLKQGVIAAYSSPLDDVP